MQQYLLTESYDEPVVLSLNESTEGKTRFRGKFQEAESKNKNNRIYPFDVLDENVKRLNEIIRHNRLVGELDHALDSIVHLTNASHKITKLWWEDNILMGEGEILSTPSGKVLKCLINDGISVGMSSRGVGNGKTNEDGVLVISDGYKLITFDIVSDPSTIDAFQEKVKKENTIPSKAEKTANKIETESVYKINKDLVLACLGSLVKSKTNDIKMGMK